MNEWNRTDTEQDRLNQIADGIKKLYLSHNRNMSKDLVRSKAELLNESLLDIPNDKIIAFFKYVRDVQGGLPSDAQIKAIWNENKLKIFGQGQTGNTSKSGYYTKDGVYVPNGTQETVLVDGEWITRFMARGIIQKPRKFWNEQDYRRTGMTDPNEIKEYIHCFSRGLK